MSLHPFKQFLDAHLNRIEPLSRNARLAYWTATISGKETDFDRYTDLDVEYKKIYADRSAFEALRDWRDSDAVTDPLERRQLSLLYRAFLENQIPENLIESISRLSGVIVNKFNVYRTEVDSKVLTNNEVRTILRESEDSDYRKKVWEADKGVGAVVRDELLELVLLRNEAASAVGFDNYYSMSLELSEQDPGQIIELFNRLDKLTRDPFREMKEEVDKVLADRCGTTVGQLLPWHYHDPYIQEAPRAYNIDLDKYFRDFNVVDLVADFFESIGLEVRDILERSDLYEKPGKEQHAYCMDIDKLGDIRVLANMQNDENWTGTLLHELGHAVYDLYIDPGLPYFLREHAHIFTTEAIAMLFGRLSKETKWIQATTGMPDGEKRSIERDVIRHQRLSQLVFTRWCQVMVRFEKSMYESPGQDLNELWWNLVEDYQMVSRPPGRNEPDWASKIHVVSAPAYYHNYMLGELLASQLFQYIQARVLDGKAGGTIPAGRNEIGRYLVEHVFRPGKKYRWDEMIEKATGEPLNPRYYIDQFVTRR
jgi:peptidyl-dipeptidase A